MWNHEGDLFDASLGSRVGATLLNCWSGSLSFNLQPRSADDRLTRGWATRPDHGEPVVQCVGVVEPSAARDVEHVRPVRAQRSRRLPLRHRDERPVKPASNVELRIAPELNRSRAIAQYVTAVTTPRRRGPFGRRYAFASIDQATLSMRMRANVAF